VELLTEHPEHLEATRSLLREYLLLPDVWDRFGGVPDRLPDPFEREVLSFPGPATPPGGEVVLAVAEGDVVAVGHLVPLGEQGCELKRMYVRPHYRRRGVATRVAGTIIDRARFLGYRRILLDVLPERVGAVLLWKSFGFRPSPPYRTYPFAVEFMEKELLPPG
jgi:putative acetyltransferase